MQETINYLINFLSGNSTTDFSNLVGYTANRDEFSHYKIVIIPSHFFDDNYYGKLESIPTLPLQGLKSIPLLFGTTKIEEIGETLVVYADIIASAYFLLTRYEEWVRTDCRDAHGRFLGKESLPYRAGFIHRPIVDEYGKLLQSWLREKGIELSKTEQKLSKIYLTHDIDQISKYRSLRGFLASVYRNIFKNGKEGKIAIKTFFGKIESDPFFSFPWLIDNNKKLIKNNKNTPIESIFFFKSLTKYLAPDKPYYNLKSSNIQLLLQECISNKISIGLHTSYLSGEKTQYISKEKEQLEKVFKQKIKYNRHHFLRSKEPMDMEELLKSGITDDFTMGYADIAGFRLGTCKPVKWINLQTRKTSSLVLHPLTIMDKSLSDKRYMDLSQKEALEYCKELIEKVKEHNGELVLLWHNTELIDSNPFAHKKLYKDLLAHLIS